MSKRNILCSLNDTSAKKSRMDQLNAFWDDDLDGDAVDDCFNRATQQNNDVTLLSSYSVFKEPEQIFTSTQFSQAGVLINQNFEQKIKELEEKYVQKEGEASILRSNLEKLRAACHMDQEKQQFEWKEKICSLEKESKRFKSELEFKNLEIANLKQQVGEFSRLVNVEQNSTQKSQITSNKVLTLASPEKKVPPRSNGNSRIYVNLKKPYPLKSFGSAFVSRASWNDSSYSDVDLQNRETIRHVTNLNVSDDSREIMSLINSLAEELRSDGCLREIQNVVKLAIVSLEKLRGCLKQVEADTPLEHAEGFSTNFVQSNRIREISIICSETLEFMREVLPFNSYIRDYLSEEQSVHFDDVKHSNIREINDVPKDTTDYLTFLSEIVSLIGRTNKEQECSKFLLSVIKLLSKLYTTGDITNERRHKAEATLRSLLLLHLNVNLVYLLTMFLDIITRSPYFVHILCSNCEKLPNNAAEESCRFLAYVVFLEKTLTNLENEKIFLNLSSSILNLVYNIFRSDSTTTYQLGNKMSISCIARLFKLATGIIYKNLVTYNISVCKFAFLLNNCINILSLLIFNTYDSTQKYVTDFAQFKDMVYILCHMNKEIDSAKLKHLEKLCTTDDFFIIPKEKFGSVKL